MATETEEDIIERAHAFYKAARDHSSNWRNDAKTWYDMVAGEQWDAADLENLNSQKRPAVTFNRIMRSLNAILGTQISNRYETRYIPREAGDAEVNEILSAASDWVRDGCEAEDEETDSFSDMTITGMGWIETRLDYTENPDGEIIIERVDPLEMYWDPAAKKRNLSDCRRLMHIKKIDKSEFSDRWPDADMEMAGAPWEDPDDSTNQREHVYPQDAYKNEQRSGRQGEAKIQVAHFQWASSKTVYRVGGQAERISGDKFEAIKDNLEKRGIKYLKQEVTVWKRAFVAGREVLEYGESPYPSGPTFHCMTCYRDRNKNLWYGVVKPMVDPQRFGNKFFSQILDILNKNAKGGLIVEEDAVDDRRAFAEDWAKPDSISYVNPGALAGGKIKDKNVAVIPPGIDRLMQFSLESVHEVTGINLEMLGFANRDQPGILEQQRKQAGLTILAPLFDAIRRYRKKQGHLMLHYIKEYISDGRLMRMTDDSGLMKYIPLINDYSVGEYDVIVDESPTSPNQKERVFSSLVEILPMLSKMGIPLPPELIDYTPIPAKLAGKWKEIIENGQQIPPEIQKQLQNLSDENQQLKSKREEAQAEMSLEAWRAQQEAEIKRKQAEADHQEALLKIQQAREESEAAIALAQWKAQQEAEIKRDKVESEIALKAISFDTPEGITPEVIKAIFRSPDAPKTIKVIRGADGFIEGAEIIQGE